jgi:cytochrome b
MVCAVCFYHVCQKLTALCSSDTVVVSLKCKWYSGEGGRNTHTRVLFVFADGLILQLTQLHMVCHLSRVFWPHEPVHCGE